MLSSLEVVTVCFCPQHPLPHQLPLLSLLFPPSRPPPWGHRAPLPIGARLYMRGTPCSAPRIPAPLSTLHPGLRPLGWERGQNLHKLSPRPGEKHQAPGTAEQGDGGEQRALAQRTFWREGKPGSECPNSSSLGLRFPSRNRVHNFGILLDCPSGSGQAQTPWGDPPHLPRARGVRGGGRNGPGEGQQEEAGACVRGDKL